MNDLYPPNATLVERIMAYVANDMETEAASLAALGDYLEECFQWDIEFDED
jgi:hypothetical protein